MTWRPEELKNPYIERAMARYEEYKGALREGATFEEFMESCFTPKPGEMYGHVLNDPAIQGYRNKDFFWEGVDAAIEALKANARYYYPDPEAGIPGHWQAFIPDEEAK